MKQCVYCHTDIEARDYFALNGTVLHVGCVPAYMETKNPRPPSRPFQKLDPEVFWGNKPASERGEEKPK